ncbi:MAG: sigma-E processing peptidase SpoIIGA [Oscillospiraceae bacterium]|nr:sigma-E processing peptidase SpoIIGA [Oscillospiraceae bacterium]
MVYTNVIYIDTLIIINLYINFFIIRACGVFLHRKTSTIRCLFGTVIGGLSSLVILLPPLPALAETGIKLLIGSVLILIIFELHGFKELIKNVLVFFVINVLFAGVMLFLSLFASPRGMIYNNSTVYFDISFMALLIFTAAAYFVIRALRYFLDVKFNAEKIYRITFYYGGEIRDLKGFADSGNTLTDFFTGLPVIVCDKIVCTDLFPDLTFDSFENVKGLRLLPYSTINGSGIIPVFKPDSVTINKKEVAALIGISKESFNKSEINAIFNPKLLF